MKIAPHPELPENNYYDSTLLTEGSGFTIDFPTLPVRHETTLNVHAKRLPERGLDDDDMAAIAFGSITIEHAREGNRFEFSSVCATTRRNAIAVAKALIKALEALPDHGVPMPDDDAPSTI